MELRQDLFTKEEGRWETFICTCSEEGIIEAGKLKQEVRRLLSEGRPEPVRPSNFLTMAVISLNWDYGACITSIANDVWSHVVAETWRGEKFTVRAQCDDVEDGIAAVWYAFWLRKNGTE